MVTWFLPRTLCAADAVRLRSSRAFDCAKYCRLYFLPHPHHSRWTSWYSSVLAWDPQSVFEPRCARSATGRREQLALTPAYKYIWTPVHTAKYTWRNTAAASSMNMNEHEAAVSSRVSRDAWRGGSWTLAARIYSVQRFIYLQCKNTCRFRSLHFIDRFK